MNLRHASLCIFALWILANGPALAQTGQGLPEGIVWYGVLKDGLEQARQTERPILLLSAAPQCAGVPGMW